MMSRILAQRERGGETRVTMAPSLGFFIYYEANDGISFFFNDGNTHFLFSILATKYCKWYYYGHFYIYYKPFSCIVKLTRYPDHDKSLLEKCLGLGDQLIDCAPFISVLIGILYTLFC